MKFRIIAFLGLLGFSFALAACSLAEDITPPPGYQYSTPLPNLGQNTQTLEAAGTSTPEPISVVTVQATSLPKAGTISTAPVIILKGKVTNASGSPLATPLTANLYLYNTGSSTVDKTLSTEVLPTGEYQFDNVPADTKVTYFVMVESSGVTYASEPLTYDGMFQSRDLPVTIYDATDDLTQLSISQIHMQFDFSVNGQVQARMLYIVSNLGQKSVVVQSDNTKISFIQIPSGATNVQYELAQGGAALANATNGFALLPGADKQYAIIASFALPYITSLDLVQPFSIPVTSETVIVPVGVRIRSDQLVDAGIQNFQGTDYHLYQGGVLATGSTLAFTISGKPGDTTSSTTNRQTAILIGIGGVGILLIGAGIFLFRRDRARISQRAEIAGVTAGAGSLNEDQDSIMDAIIALDDQYKSGCISRETYDKRREELKKKLKELI